MNLFFESVSLDQQMIPAAKTAIEKSLHFIFCLRQFSYFSIRSAAIMPEAITVGTPPPGWVEAPVR